MFIVFSKEKIVSYCIALATVIVLFLVASTFKDNNINTIKTSANLEKRLPIYCVNTTENKVALTLNCAWNADDIDMILKILEENNCKVTFFMVGDWVDKYRRSGKKDFTSST